MCALLSDCDDQDQGPWSEPLSDLRTDLGHLQNGPCASTLCPQNWWYKRASWEHLLLSFRWSSRLIRAPWQLPFGSPQMVHMHHLKASWQHLRYSVSGDPAVSSNFTCCLSLKKGILFVPQKGTFVSLRKGMLFVPWLHNGMLQKHVQAHNTMKI